MCVFPGFVQAPPGLWMALCRNFVEGWIGVLSTALPLACLCLCLLVSPRSQTELNDTMELEDRDCLLHDDIALYETRNASDFQSNEL